MVEHATEVVPRRRVVRSQRYLLLCETAQPNQDRSERSPLARSHETADARKLPPEDVLPIHLTPAHPALPHHEEPVVPRRVVPHIILEQLLDPRELARPEVVLVVEVREDPLAVRPGVVVLRVRAQRAGDEREFPRRGVDGAQRGEQQATVVPDLVRLEELDREAVHQLELGLERRVEREQRPVSVLPASP